MINVKQINEIEDKRRTKKKEIYKTIYAQFSNKIKCAVDMKQRYVHLRVPVFVMGYPTYDIHHAASYLQRQLKLGGFDVKPISEIDFVVTWKLKSTSSKPRNKRVTTQSDDGSCTSFANLRKIANKYR